MRAFGTTDPRQWGKISRLISISNDRGLSFLYTDSQNPIVTDAAIRFEPFAGASLKRLQFRNDGDVSNGEFAFVPKVGGVIQPKDVAARKLDGAIMQIYLCDSSLPAPTAYLIQTGVLGNVTEEESSFLATLETRGQMTIAKGLEEKRFGPMCRADYGDDDCRIALIPPDIGRNQAYAPRDTVITVAAFAGRARTGATGGPSDYANVHYEAQNAGTTAGTAPTYNPAIDSTTTDGSVTFLAVESDTRYATVAAVADEFNLTLTALPDARAVVDGWFTFGVLRVWSPNTDRHLRILPIANWLAAGNQVVTWVSTAGVVQAGDEVEIMRGCGKKLVDCQARNNVNNQRAEPLIPGRNFGLAAIIL